MITHKQSFHHSTNKHKGNNGGHRGPPQKVPAAVVWSRLGPSTLLIASTDARNQQHLGPPMGHQIHVPMGTRKIVNPVTVNALKSIRARCQPPPPPLPPQITSAMACPLGSKCCSCNCYCCCDSEKSPSTQFRLNPSQNHNKNSRMSTCSEKSRRRRSRSRDSKVPSSNNINNNTKGLHSNNVYRNKYPTDPRNLIGVCISLPRILSVSL